MTFRAGRVASIIGVALGLSACGSDGGSATQNKTVTRTAIKASEFKPVELENTVNALVKKIGEAPAADLQVAIVLKQLSNYYLPVQTGASRAMSELNLVGQVVAPSTSSGNTAIDEQNNIMNAQLDSGYNALGVSPFELPNAAPIDRAADLGMPSVTLDSDLPTSKRDIYLGTMNAEAGKTAAATLRSLMPASSGTVILLGHDDAGWPDGYDRTMGAKNALETAGFTVQIRRTDWSDVGEAADMDFMKEAIATAEPPVVGMMGMFSNAYRCAMAAEAVGKTASDITIAAFDFEPQTVAYMRSGFIKATHAQRQYYMGYMTPYVLYSLKALGKDATKDILKSQMVDDHRFNTGLDVIPADKLDNYYSYLDSLGIGNSN